MKQKRKTHIAFVHLELLREVYWLGVATEVMCHKERVLDSLKQPITPQDNKEFKNERE